MPRKAHTPDVWDATRIAAWDATKRLYFAWAAAALLAIGAIRPSGHYKAAVLDRAVEAMRADGVLAPQTGLRMSEAQRREVVAPVVNGRLDPRTLGEAPASLQPPKTTPAPKGRGKSGKSAPAPAAPAASGNNAPDAETVAAIVAAVMAALQK